MIIKNIHYNSDRCAALACGGGTGNLGEDVLVYNYIPYGRSPRFFYSRATMTCRIPSVLSFGDAELTGREELLQSYDRMIKTKRNPKVNEIRKAAKAERRATKIVNSVEQAWSGTLKATVGRGDVDSDDDGGALGGKSADPPSGTDS